MVVLTEAGNILDLFKENMLGFILAALPLLLLASPVHSAKDFAVYRMQHYDLQTIKHGSRTIAINMEARSIAADTVTRRCVMLKVQEFTGSLYKDLLAQNVGSLLILLPSEINSLLEKEKEMIRVMERELLAEQTNVPVYFALETPEVQEVYEAVVHSSSAETASAVDALLSSILANGFQVVVNGGAPSPLNNFQVVNIHGVLSGQGVAENLPSIVISAHYDAFGVAPSLSKGTDSNGSGIAMLLELARLFSKLYANARTHPKFNIVFLLSGAGKFNYFGTKKWLEEFHDSSKFPYLSDVATVLCLDSLGQGGQLYAHVSKPPKEGSSGHTLLKNVLAHAEEEQLPYEQIHKKIRLGEPTLAWEHEQWSIRRLPAITLSALPTHKSPTRASITDSRSSVDGHSLVKSTRVVAESIAKLIFNITEEEAVHVFQDDLAVSGSFLSSWLDILSSESRAAQLLDKNHPLIAAMETALSRSLTQAGGAGNKAQRSLYAPDKREPEVVFYGNAQEVLHAYSVKPAIFDLVLAAAICAYLGLVYVAAQNFNRLYSVLRHSTPKAKSN